MTELVRDQYRRLRSQARHAFVELVEALNRRDMFDDELRRSRHPLPPARIEYLSAELILAHQRCEHYERELDDYAATLKRLARELGVDEFEDESRGDKPPAVYRPPHAQLGLFA